MNFIRYLLECRFFRKGDILVMDNVAIHVGHKAVDVDRHLWNHIQDGEPLNVLVVFLPLRCPELNPIELVFNILSSWIKSFKSKRYGLLDKIVIRHAQEVLTHMSSSDIQKCYKKCGYNNNIYND